MLKYILTLTAITALLVSFFWISARTLHVRAASTSIQIIHVQAGGAGAATQERVVLFNPGESPVDLTGWCLVNKNNETIACFDELSVQYSLPGYSYTNIVSSSFAAAHSAERFARVYEPLNRTSGSITGSAASVTLKDSGQRVVDEVAWTQSIPGGSVIERRTLEGDGTQYFDTDTWADWRMYVASVFVPFEDGLEVEEAHAECEVPCEETVRHYPVITELLPNAASSDDGTEFIEFYNSHDAPISLEGLVLVVASASAEKRYPLPAETVIEPNNYFALYNSTVKFSLNNTAGSVWLEGAAGMIGEVIAYQSPPEARSWALIEGEWSYTNQPSPDMENRTMIITPTLTSAVAASLKPCLETQYRSLETNRCRNLATSESTPTPCRSDQYRSEETNRCRNIAIAATQTPCKEGQYRSPETNRCRNIASQNTAPTPCKEGQERNPETNRCRTIKKVTQADYGVLAAKDTPGGANWYLWAIIAGVGLLAIGYATWEWRVEIATAASRMKQLVRARK